MSPILTFRLPSRPRHDRATSQVHSGGPATPTGSSRRFPFLLAAMALTVVAAFALFAGTVRDASDPEPFANPWGEHAGTHDRVPATPSRGAMGRSTDAIGGSPQPVSARTAPQPRS